MAKMKEFGLKLMNALIEDFEDTLNLETSIRNVVEVNADSYDRAWLTTQVRAMANHPEYYGHSETLFDDIRKMARERAEAKARRPQNFSLGE